MAKVNGPFQFTGKLGDLIYYKLPGSDQTYVRYASGPSSERVKTAPEFANTRRHNAEFQGASKAASLLYKSFGEIRYLKDYNFFGDLTKFNSRIRVVDEINEKGERSILFSKKGSILDGFNFNKARPFDTIIRYPIVFGISRENSRATVQIPELIPNYNFYPPKDKSLYEVRIAFAMLADMVYTTNGYIPAVDCEHLRLEATTGWSPVIEPQQAKSLEVTLPSLPGSNCSLVLSIGIRYGSMLGEGYVLPAPKSGSGKILAIR